jgi:two-component system, chemotaxis family, sensor kinase CheA
VSELGADLADMFRNESSERLDQMDTVLLAIEAGEAGDDSVDMLFRHAHTIKGAAGMLGFDDIRRLASAVEDILAVARDHGRLRAGLAGPLLRATGVLRARLTGAEEPVDGLLDDLAAAVAAPEGAGPAGEPAPDRAGTGEAAPSPPDRDTRETGQQAARPPPEQQPLRVPAQKIDHLLDIVGEVIQYRSQLEHSSGEPARMPEDAADVLGGGEGMLDELRHTAVAMRMQRLAAITGRLPRAVRDLALAAGKDAELVVTGADTELDRVILQGLYEPLVHLLRNAVTHGIEPPEDRERAAKPVRGRLEVSATSRGSLVEIVVSDDGRGVSPEVIDAAQREGSLADVLAAPGYSTAQDVTDLAGRGVGLDAVKAYAHSVAGTLEVRSHPGRGTAVVLLLPVALALVRVLLFERAGAVYGLPLAVVEQAVEVSRGLTLAGRPALEVGGKPLPVADIAALVGTAAPPLADRSPGLVISAGGRRAVAACDRLRGQDEVVVKPLGPLLDSVEGYLGAAILGDGQVALLLEPTVLARRFRRPPATEAPAPPAGPRTPPRILVVEDSFTVRELQRSILEAAGYLVVTARDGQDALRLLDRDREIALVVTDLEMPGLDGLGLTRRIRADRARSSLPVVIVTSRGSADDRRQGIEAGADVYVAKQSFDQHALLTTVERLVGR